MSTRNANRVFVANHRTHDTLRLANAVPVFWFLNARVEKLFDRLTANRP